MKLPELLLSEEQPKSRYEQAVTSHLAMGVLLEFGARNIEQPMRRIHLERPYPGHRNSQSSRRADLYVDLSQLFSGLRGRYHFGMKDHNWVETKFFIEKERHDKNIATTENVARLARDLFRLCLHVPETDVDGHHSNGRYLLAVFSEDPSHYLALNRGSPAGTSRRWVRRLLNPGVEKFTFELGEEPEGTFLPLFGRLAPDTRAEIKVQTHNFTPVGQHGQQTYFGSLSRMIDFTITTSGTELQYQDLDRSAWTEEQRRKHAELSRLMEATKKDKA